LRGLPSIAELVITPLLGWNSQEYHSKFLRKKKIEAIKIASKIQFCSFIYSNQQLILPIKEKEAVLS
jgi:hypothetical protein